jgi:hypothetical protein
MATKIKYSAGDKVYWLSSKGFQEGIVKQVILTDSISINNKQRILRKEVRFLLWSENYPEVYMGDEVKESEIFTSYKTMAKHYLNKNRK